MKKFVTPQVRMVLYLSDSPLLTASADRQGVNIDINKKAGKFDAKEGFTFNL